MNIQTLQLIQYSLFGGAVPDIRDWDIVLRELEQQALLPLVETKGLLIPESAEQKLTQARYGNRRKFIRHSMALAELNELFGKPVIFKGFSAAQYYPVPANRTIGDLDFMVPGADFKLCQQKLLDNGFQQSDIPVTDRHPRHIAFDKGTVHFELHSYFTKPTSEGKRRLDKRIETTEPVEVSLDGTRFYSMPEPVNGLILLEHLDHHRHDGLGMRQMLDWVCYVNRWLTDERWENELRLPAQDASLEALAVYATAFGEKYLGLSHRRFTEGAEERICELLLEEISDCGNFGRVRREDKVLGGAVRFREDGHPFRRLQGGGLYNWTYAHHHPWARPFAWLYQIFHILGILLHSNNTARRLSDSRQVSARLREIDRALEQ